MAPERAMICGSERILVLALPAAASMRTMGLLLALVKRSPSPAEDHCDMSMRDSPPLMAPAPAKPPETLPEVLWKCFCMR